MGCVSLTNFTVFINECASIFFKVTRGIMQGCPSSTLLFFLVVEALSLLVKNVDEKNKVKGVRVIVHVTLTHFHFVDDVLVFVIGSFDEWEIYKDILNPFSSTTCKQASIQKLVSMKNLLPSEFKN